MTTYASNSVACGACGTVSIQPTLASTNEFGSPDLDLRPPVMKRHTMDAWVHRCPACGFSAHDLTKWDERFRPVMESAEYQALLAESSPTGLASTFLFQTMLAMAVDKRDEAAHACLHAAWVFDDEKSDTHARECRNKAADLMLELISEGKAIHETPGGSEALAIDCLRRAGRGAEALQVADRVPSENLPDIVSKILSFQRILIERNDTAAHTIKEAAEAS